MALTRNGAQDHLKYHVCKAGMLHQFEGLSQTSTRSYSPLLDSSGVWQDDSAASLTSQAGAPTGRSHWEANDHLPCSDMHAAVRQAREQTSLRRERVSPTLGGEHMSEEGNVQKRMMATTFDHFGQLHSSPGSDDVPLLFHQCGRSAPSTQPCDEKESALWTEGEDCQSPSQSTGSCEIPVLTQNVASLDTRENLHELHSSSEDRIERLSPLDELLDVLGPMLLDDPFLSKKEFERLFPDEIQQRSSETGAPSDDADTFARLNTLLGDLSQLFDDGLDDLSGATLTSQGAQSYGAPGHLRPWTSANSYVSSGQYHESAVNQSSRSASLDATDDWPQDGSSSPRPHFTLSSPSATFSKTPLLQDPIFDFDFVN